MGKMVGEVLFRRKRQRRLLESVLLVNLLVKERVME